MAWSDILGAIGGVASAIGGGVGGDIGNIAKGVGSLASLGGAISQASTASGQSQQAQQQTQQATNQALGLAQAQDKRAAGAYNKATGLIPQYTAAYDKELASLGPYPTLDPNAVAARANQLLPVYMTDADKELTKGFSSDMGKLMRAGTDTSTYGVAARAAWGDQAAQTHAKIYNQAYTDALSYVKDITAGQQAARTAQIKETVDPYANAISAYTDLYGKTPSSADALKQALSGTGQLVSQADTNAQAAGVGSAISGVKGTFGDLVSGIKSVLGWNNNTSNDTSATAAVPGIYGSDATGGSMGGHI